MSAATSSVDSHSIVPDFSVTVFRGLTGEPIPLTREEIAEAVVEQRGVISESKSKKNVESETNEVISDPHPSKMQLKESQKTKSVYFLDKNKLKEIGFRIPPSDDQRHTRCVLAGVAVGILG